MINNTLYNVKKGGKRRKKGYSAVRGDSALKGRSP